MKKANTVHKNTPYLPPIPRIVCSKENPVQNLTNRTQGEWQFLFRAIPDIPSPYGENQDYDFTAVGETEWQDVLVPSSLIMQGFDIKNNTEYYYRRKIKLPPYDGKRRLVLRFAGVYSNARVWIDNRFIKTHIGGFTPWDCDITGFAGRGEITLIVGVTDIEGAQKGIWNPAGETVSDAAWASYYAHCNVGGILRDITLFTLPQNYIARTHVHTRLFGSDAVVAAYIEAHAVGDVCAQIVLEGEDGAVLAHADSYFGTMAPEYKAVWHVCPDEKWKRTHQKAFQNDEKYKKLFVPFAGDFSATCSGEVAVSLRHPKLWDAEHPNLYTLKIRLLVNGEVQQENVQKIGIREITYGGQNGTDKNKIYVNGSAVKLRGVCRHDVSHLYGRSLTKEDIYHEILTYKKNNVNFIRTSHYPAEEYLLKVCDELGIYVEQENAACFKGANNFEIYNAPQAFLQSFAEMIESARNHACVILWSLANESNFEKTYAFRAEFDYVKQVDTSRPVIFSYPHLVRTKPLPYDVRSKHYAKVTGKLGDKDCPLLHDEFAHVACYNVARLQKDNSVREFWGESIRLGWERIFNTDGALGCAIWAATDDVFCLPPGTSESHQSHSNGPYAGYGEWGCIFDAFKREKPEAYLTKKAFTPVLVDESKTEFGKTVRLHVQNRFDHTDLKEVKMLVTSGEATVYNDYIGESVAPHSRGIITFPGQGLQNVLVQFYFGRILVDTYRLANGSAPTAEVPGTSDLVSCIDLPGSVLRCKGAKFKIKQVKSHGQIQVQIVPANLPAWFARPDDCTLKLKLRSGVQSVSWQRHAPYSFYPAGHIGRAQGMAYPAGTDNLYGVKPPTPWEADNENYFLYPVSAGKRGLSNDFLTRRNHVQRFTISLLNGKKLHLASRSGINVLVCPCEEDKEHLELQISTGCYYPDLQWGNYFGRRFLNWKDRRFVFSVSCAEEGNSTDKK